VSNKPQAFVLSGSFVGVLTHLFADAALGLVRQLSLQVTVSNKP
jgi:hypothetical protein